MRELTRAPTGPALAFAVGLALAAAPAAAQERPDTTAQARQARTIQVEILGMSCPFCAYGVEQKMQKLEGVEKLNVELQSGIATLTMAEGADVSNQRLRQTVEDAGFETAAIVRSFESQYQDVNPDRIPGEAESGSEIR